MFNPWDRIAVGWWRCSKASRHRAHESGDGKKGNSCSFLPGMRLGVLQSSKPHSCHEPSPARPKPLGSVGMGSARLLPAPQTLQNILQSGGPSSPGRQGARWCKMLHPCGKCLHGSTQSSFWWQLSWVGAAPSAPLGPRMLSGILGQSSARWRLDGGVQELNSCRTAEKHLNRFKRLNDTHRGEVT